MKEKALVLWSGGKDCNLALHLAKQEGYEICALVTFCSESTEFRAHPKEWMELQSRSLDIPHVLVKIQKPFAKNYELQLYKLKEALGIEVLVSGDISEVHESPNWISERAKAVGLKTFLPLWHKDREEVMDLLLKFNFEVVLTMVKTPWLGRQFLRRRIGRELLEEFRILGLQNGLDLCGEQGEYHTMVLNGPGYRSVIELKSYQTIQSQEMFHFRRFEACFGGVGFGEGGSPVGWGGVIMAIPRYSSRFVILRIGKFTFSFFCIKIISQYYARGIQTPDLFIFPAKSGLRALINNNLHFY